MSLTYAHKESHINTVDIVGAFIKAKILDDKDLVMKKNRELTKLFRVLSSGCIIELWGIICMQ